MSLEFVDADAHVVEVELGRECLRRWPEAFTLHHGVVPEIHSHNVRDYVLLSERDLIADENAVVDLPRCVAALVNQ